VSAHNRPEGARSPLRRLSRSEIDHTLRDLFGLTDHPALALPPDDFSNGFENQAISAYTTDLFVEGVDALMSSVAARLTLRLPEAPTLTLRGPDDLYLTAGQPTATLPRDERGVLLESRTTLSLGFMPSVPGGWRVEFDVEPTTAPASGVLRTVIVYCEGQTLASVPWREDGPHTVAIDVDVPSHVEGALDQEGQPTAPVALTGLAGQTGLTVEIVDGRAPVRVTGARVIGPTAPTLPVEPGRDRLWVCDPYAGTPDEGRSCVSAILDAVLPRAWRRPTTPDDLGRVMAWYDQALSEIAAEPEAPSFVTGAHPWAFEAALSGVLMSPEFLFLLEPHSSPQAGPWVAASGERSTVVDPWALASRLSYGLWEGPPDDELRARAADGSLYLPEERAAQARRMLRDPRAVALVDDLVSPWLGLRSMEAYRELFGPGADLWQVYTDHIAEARDAAERVFLPTASPDAGAATWRPLQALFTDSDRLLSATIAQRYGLDAPEGSSPERWDVGPLGRAGWLGLGGLQIATSRPTRTSPIARGAWILRNLLCAAPPPPPPAVTSLEAAPVPPDATIRERLAAHSADPACAACHVGMDPYGLAMEDFDYRGLDVRLYGTTDGHPPDATATLPGGREIQGLEELTQVLAEDDRTLPCVVEKVFTFLYHRAPTGSDEAIVQSVAAALRRDTATFEDVVVGLVASPSFALHDFVPAQALPNHGEGAP
jgi:hypothetical protein